MALPTLDATFASSADLPRKQMLAKWLVEELGETQAPSNVLVSGLADTQYNGLYVYDGVVDGKPSYRLNSNVSIYSSSGNVWNIVDDSAGNGIAATSSAAYPWLVTGWVDEGINPTGLVITESPTPSPLSNYYSLPERYLWAKIAVAVGAPKTEADYISLPKNYVWSDIYNAVAGSSGNHTDWSENVALGHIAAAYRGDTANPANLATYIDWPWRYKVAAIIDHLIGNYNAVIVSGAGTTELNGTYTKRGVSNGKPYYNLIGSPDSELSNAIWWEGFEWRINSFDDGPYYVSSNNAQFPWNATGWVDSNGTPPSPTLTPTNV